MINCGFRITDCAVVVFPGQRSIVFVGSLDFALVILDGTYVGQLFVLTFQKIFLLTGEMCQLSLLCKHG